MKIYKILAGLIAVLLFPMFMMAQSEARLLRFPAISGDKLVFSYAGDLYTVARSGGMARKITNDAGYEMFARFSPDGKWIAFTAQYDGNTEVYKIPSTGGEPQRLTYTAQLGRDDISDRMGPNNIVMAWTPDGKNVVYRSRKQTFNDFKGQLFSVSSEGGMSTELPLPAGGFCSYSPDGKKLAYNRIFREFRTWKYYKGGMADDISIYDFETKSTTKITNTVNQEIEPMWFGDKIFFLSDRDRTMNLFEYSFATNQTRKLTNFTEFDIKFANAGKDAIAFENGGFIYIFDIKTEKSEKLNITIADDFDRGRNEIKDGTKNLFNVNISPDGKRVVASARGEVFSVPVKSGITRNLTNSSAAHDRDASWSPDGKYIAYLSDKNGEYEIYIQKQDATEAAIQITQHADTYKFNIQWSPDSKKILWNDKMLRLQYVDIESKSVTLVDKSEIWEFGSFNWSPDSKWIVYASQQTNKMGVIMLYNTDTKQKTAVTDNWYDSNQPSFSSDGKYLLFSSERDFNPIYSATEWNAAYRDMSKIYMLVLSKDTPGPFAPENDEVKISEEKKDDKKDAKKDEPKVALTKIDLEGLADRILALPLTAGNYWNIYGINDFVYYNAVASGDDEQSAKIFDLKKKKETELGKGLNFDISADLKKMLVVKGGSYYVVDLPTGKINLEDKPVDMSGLKIKVNNKEEWKQIYDESWRQMRDFFYVSNMHGVNWQAMHDKYAVLLPYVNDRNDLNYLIGELIGELSVGHAYVGGGDRKTPDKINTGLLGAKLSKDASGYFRVDKILQGANWSTSLRSPLTELGVNVSEGNFILAVNGKSVKEITDIYSELVNTAGKLVELTVNTTASEQGARKVLVTPVKSEADLYYYSWVQNNIKKVSEATKGEVGYIHIPDMGVEGLNEFVKYFYPQLDKKALIIDDRGNGGGNVSPMILERLQREATRANMARNVTIPGHTPQQMMLGPKVLLIDHYSASDGDLFPYGFKKHGIGKVVGTRSWGGVVGIRGSLPFVDGGDLRKPEFASYSSEESKWIIEGIGVEPDINIENDPAKEYSGIDEQLNKAIEIALDEIKTYKGVPPIPVAPDKSK